MCQVNDYLFKIVQDHVKEEVLKSIAKVGRSLETLDREGLAMELLWPAHLCSRSDVWVELAQSLKIDPGKLLSQRQNEVYDKIIKQFDGSEHMKAVLKTAAFVVGVPVIKNAVAKFKTLVGN
jgi:hypothetical protein